MSALGKEGSDMCDVSQSTHTYIHTGYETQPALAFSVVLEDCDWIDWIGLSVGLCLFSSGVETTQSFQHLPALC